MSFFWFAEPIHLLLLLQALCLASPIAILQQHFKSKLSRYAYLLFFPVWFCALNDFHPDVFCVPVLSLFFKCLSERKTTLALIVLAILSSIKEIFIIQSLFCHIALWLTYGREPTAKTCSEKKLIFLSFGATILYLAITLILLSASVDLSTQLSAPSGMYKIQPTSLTLQKITLLTFLGLSVGFVGLKNWKLLITAVPIIAVPLVSNVPNHSWLSAHYLIGATIPIIICFDASMSGSKFGLKGRSLIALSIITTHILISCSPISRIFWQDKVEKYGRSGYGLSSDKLKKINLLKKFSSSHKDAIISVQNNINFPGIHSVKELLVFPDGVFSEHQIPVFRNFGGWYLKPVQAEFVIIDTDIEPFLGDKSCIMLFGVCTQLEMLSDYEKSLDKLNLSFREVESQSGLKILQRER